MEASLQKGDPKPRALLKVGGLLVFFLVAAAVIGYFVFVSVRNFVVSWEMTDLPGVVVKEPEANPGTVTGSGESVAPHVDSVSGPAPQPWDGASRVNVLVMGLDYRDWEVGEGAPRTDTMILVSVDPLSRTAGMLSIPRDLWVNIPGFDPNRINVAYRFGEVYELPGGGPGLAMKTVEELLGLKIDYYALIEFHAFERLIDEIDGVEVDVQQKIKVDPIEGKTKVLKPGRQVLPGNLALAYARVRYTDGGDFDRAQRQQQVIMGIRERLMDPGALPKYLARAHALYEELSAGVHTNMTLEQAIQLAWLLQQVPEENIKRGVIDAQHVTFGKSPEGDDVLKPLAAKIRMLRDEIFTASDLVSPVAAAATPQELVMAEDARITILNGANTPGLAARTMDYLKGEGFNVVETGDDSEVSLYTTVIDYTGNPKTTQSLVNLMSIAPHRIYLRYDPTSQADIVLILGYDWANNHSMP